MRTRRVTITLSQDYHSFIELKQDKFFDDLANIIGVERAAFRNVKIRKACVLISSDMDDATARRLMELFDKYKNGNLDGPEAKEIEAFFKKYNFRLCNSVSKESAPSKQSGKNLAVFVHGLRGNTDTFGKLPEFLENHNACVSVCYAYPSSLKDKSPPISFIANNLDNFIRNRLPSDDAKLALIGYSMGGVILRDMLGRQLYSNAPLDSLVSLATFIASPLNGAWIAKLGAQAPIIRKDQIADLSPSSSYLTDIINRWFAWREKTRSAEIYVRSIFGTEDNIVDPALAVGDDPSAIAIIGGTHSNIVKPKKEDDEIVRTLQRLFLEAGLKDTSG